MTKSVDHLISERAKSRVSSHFTSAPSEAPPSGFKPHPKPLLLSYGTPNNGFFPIDSLDINLVHYPFEHQDKKEARGESLKRLAASSSNSASNGKNGKAESYDNSVEVVRHTQDPSIVDLSTGLQYANVEGHKPLLQFTKDFIKRTHNPAHDQWESILTTGASDGLNKACDAVLNPGDVVLIEEFTFLPFVRFSDHAQAIPVPVKIDFSNESNGIDLGYLRELLDNWHDLKPNLPKPKALYTIATGQNPTGYTQTVEFRKQVYELAEKHDFIIIEDDPYGYLTLPKYQHQRPTNDSVKSDVTIDDYIANHLTPSYLELDTTGRVIRVETFSKLFAPGLRLGFIIAHASIIKAIKNYGEVVNRGASGLSQLAVNNVVYGKLGGVDGWIGWILKMRQRYSLRKDLLLHTIYQSEAYKQGLVDVIDPKAGMFVTFKIKFLDARPENEIVAKMKQALWKVINFGVAVVPGSNMAVDSKFSAARSNFFRLCYAPANDDAEIVESGKRLTDAILDFYNNGEKF
ncbi:uncharacterized protein LODBEIA_P40070 [Lodderomyces beijingensis]|uniref:Aminotransferase class I/classII large domain-containing protein n=1 Tax=Lodderomyces beijingensis TaxID=1775926 RepID=A0ABP0ZQ25_9ASCO